MSAPRLLLGLAVLGLVWGLSMSDAQAQRAKEYPKYGMDGQPWKPGGAQNNHTRGITRSYDYKFGAGGTSSRNRGGGHSGGHSGGGHHYGGGHHHHGHGYPYPVPYPVYPSYGYGYGYGDYYPYYSDFYYGTGPFVLPPVTLPAETLYGPQAVKRLLGVEQGVGDLPGVDPAVIHAAPQPDLILRNDPPLGDVRDRREVNAESIQRAKRFIGFGDARFADQRWHEALQRYKDAMEAAPTLAEVYFRQGHANLALSRYNQAALAYQRGLKLQPNWPQSDFRFDDLFGDNRAALLAMRERLAEAASDDPENDTLLFLLGVVIHFSGEPERAQLFFRRAQQIAADTTHLTPFLALPAEAVGRREF